MDNSVTTELSEHIGSKLTGLVQSTELVNDELVLHTSVKSIEKLLKFLKDDIQCKFEILLDICGVDYPERDSRFEVVYHLLSISNNQRVRVKVPLKEGEAIPSVASMYSSAGWFEREAWDLFGIFFEGNQDLRRILNDYGFDGHPLRKDFPLSGFVELRYDDEQKRVVYEPVKLTQEFRRFDFMSPWEGADYILPGDEKVED
tara:strand:- start:16213 stop:16818 length:606 start_codon:yes stop_codon:yes gene_type:complete